MISSVAYTLLCSFSLAHSYGSLCVCVLFLFRKVIALYVLGIYNIFLIKYERDREERRRGGGVEDESKLKEGVSCRGCQNGKKRSIDTFAKRVHDRETKRWHSKRQRQHKILCMQTVLEPLTNRLYTYEYEYVYID